MATILKISAENFLSLENVDLDLRSLNVLVGPNGAGKTNILKLFQFLGDVARLDLIPAIELMGDFENLLFRGEKRRGQTIKIKFSAVLSQHASLKAPDEYTLSFWQRSYPGRQASEEQRRITQRNEEIVLKRTAGRGRRITLSGGSAKVTTLGSRQLRSAPNALRLRTSSTGLATLRRLGEDYDAEGIESLAQTFEQLRLFEVDVERVRRPIRWLSPTFLRPDAANIATYLMQLRESHPLAFEQISADVKFVLPGFKRFKFTPVGGADEVLRLDIEEEKLVGATPLARSSFGTIRAIALFTMLNDPSPPKLTCLEEIDHGLHPHALDRLVERVREASTKTQIILATHSPALVNRLDPNELLVVEREPETGGTRVMRPDEALVNNLKKETGYGLGELWFSGSIGGGL